MGRMDPITMCAFDEDCSVINMPSTTSSEKWICSPTSVLETTEVTQIWLHLSPPVAIEGSRLLFCSTD